MTKRDKSRGRIRHMISVAEVKHATTMTLAHLNDVLTGLPEHEILRLAVKEELIKRRNR